MDATRPADGTERLIARGRYAYYHNGKALDIDERWSIHQKSDSHFIIRSERNSPALGHQILVHSEHHGNVITFVELRWRFLPNNVPSLNGKVNTADSFPKECTAVYEIGEGGINVSRNCRDAQGELEFVVDDTVSASFGFITAPLMRIYIGSVVHQINRMGGKAYVLVPRSEDPAGTEKLFQAQLAEHKVNYLGRDELHIQDLTYATRCFEYCGGEYRPGSRLWLDKNDMLIQYSWQEDPQNLWEVRLIDVVWQPTS